MKKSLFFVLLLGYHIAQAQNYISLQPAILSANPTGLTNASTDITNPPTALATGAGTRLMWIPSRSAFRVGSVFDASGTESNSWNATNIGLFSFASGINTLASGKYATSIGQGTTASGGTSTSMGGATIASGDFSTSMGVSTVASGYVSTSMGYQTYATGLQTTSMGSNTMASGDFSASLGTQTTAQAYASVVLGRYNVIAGTIGSWVASEPLFVIGNGSNGGSRNNALTVLKNGQMGVGTTNPLATIEAVRGTGSNGTAAFQGTTWTSHFNYSTAEHTYIRGGKDGANVIINDVATLGNVGIGTTSPNAKLEVNGNIRSSSLAGTGTRDVYVDANGTLTTTPQTYYVSVPHTAFIESNPASTRILLDYSLYYSDISVSRTLYFPILLPHGATLTNVRINYLDQSIYTSSFSLLVSNLNGSNPTVTSLGSTTNAISGSTSTGLTQAIDNSSSGYTLKITFISDNADMRLNGAILTYTK